MSKKRKNTKKITSGPPRPHNEKVICVFTWAKFQAIFVRLLLMIHNGLTAWLVVQSYNDYRYWLVATGNVLIVLEGIIIIVRRGGVEYSWWCPCFLVYLMTTLPGICLLQLYQNTVYVETFISNDTSLLSNYTTYIANGTNSEVSAHNVAATLNDTLHLTMTSINNGSQANLTTPIAEVFKNVTQTVLTNISSIVVNTTTSASVGYTMTPVPDLTTAMADVSYDVTSEPNTNVTMRSFSIMKLLVLDKDVWMIIVQEGLIYLLVLGRWMLPRGKVSRHFLADMLLEFLAIASDIMELFAVFDEDSVRADRKLTYIILIVWTASFIQFVPILMQKKRFQHFKNLKQKERTVARQTRDRKVEVLVTCMSIFLQDGPFLGLRLYIMIYKNLITYSLVFFVLKNIVTLLLLFYRLAIVCYRLPCCCSKHDRVDAGDSDHVVDIELLSMEAKKK